MHLNKGYPGEKNHFVTKVSHLILHLPNTLHYAIIHEGDYQPWICKVEPWDYMYVQYIDYFECDYKMFYFSNAEVSTF